MTFKRLTSLAMFVGFVLFSYAVGYGQQTTTTTTTTTSTNPRVVVTDNLSKPTTADSSQAAKPATNTTKIGNYSVNVTEGVTATAQTQQSGKFLTVTKWDGTKWVTKREFVPTSPTAAKPNP